MWQTMDRGLLRAIAAQEVSVWAQLAASTPHSASYELEKVPCLLRDGGISICSVRYARLLAQRPVLGGVLK